MLSITIPATDGDLFDERTNRFLTLPEETLLIEHSLVSLSKWEALFEKPFLAPEKKTNEEALEYIKLMNLAPVSSPQVYERLTQSNMDEISTYIDRKMTATVFSELPLAKGGVGEYISSEVIYYWMVALQIPFECQHWHLNRLTTLIRVVNLKNSPAKKMSRAEANAQKRALNEQRKAAAKSSG